MEEERQARFVATVEQPSSSSFPTPLSELRPPALSICGSCGGSDLAVCDSVCDSIQSSCRASMASCFTGATPSPPARASTAQGQPSPSARASTQGGAQRWAGLGAAFHQAAQSVGVEPGALCGGAVVPLRKCGAAVAIRATVRMRLDANSPARNPRLRRKHLGAFKLSAAETARRAGTATDYLPLSAA